MFTKGRIPAFLQRVNGGAGFSEKHNRGRRNRMKELQKSILPADWDDHEQEFGFHTCAAWAGSLPGRFGRPGSKRWLSSWGLNIFFIFPLRVLMAFGKRI
jgi:hypothetical protein